LDLDWFSLGFGSVWFDLGFGSGLVFLGLVWFGLTKVSDVDLVFSGFGLVRFD
jgi:hypothetical protein